MYLCHWSAVPPTVMGMLKVQGHDCFQPHNAIKATNNKEGGVHYNCSNVRSVEGNSHSWNLVPEVCCIKVHLDSIARRLFTPSTKIEEDYLRDP